MLKKEDKKFKKGKTYTTDEIMGILMENVGKVVARSEENFKDADDQIKLTVTLMSINTAMELIYESFEGGK